MCTAEIAILGSNQATAAPKPDDERLVQLDDSRLRHFAGPRTEELGYPKMMTSLEKQGCVTTSGSAKNNDVKSICKGSILATLS